MSKKTYFVGSLAATAALLAAGTPAYADSVDNDGINVGNGNNISVAPIQACGNDVAVLGLVIPILSPEFTECSGNGNIVDKNKTWVHDDEDCDKKCPDGGNDDNGKHDNGDMDNGDNGDMDNGNGGNGNGENGNGGMGDNGNGGGMPTAPTPDVKPGHAAVTG